MRKLKINKYVLIPFIVSFLLFLIPFFWLKPGEIDLGGDSSRLYFFDPYSYLQTNSLYGVGASNIGGVNIYYFNTPFIIFLIFLKSILVSSTFFSCFFHGINISAAFLFVFLITKELIQGNAKKNSLIVTESALIGGLLYIFSPALLDGWTYVLISHNQVFLNPLIFYLLLKFFKTMSLKYLYLIILIAFLFSSSFSLVAAPALFAFYPISIVFLILYTIFVLHQPIEIKKILMGLLGFFLTQAFHLFPQANIILSPGDTINTTIFSDEGKFVRGLSYFSSILPNIKLSINLLLFPQMREFNPISFLFIFFPFIVLIAFFCKKNKTFLLTSLFFLITLFFETANITNIGVWFYKSLFNIPGFSMFRNFYGQWQFVYVFFYALIVGQAFFMVFTKSKFVKNIVIGVLILVLLLYAVPFINGNVIRTNLWQSKNVKSIIRMDPEYEKVLAYIRSLPIDGKFLTLPLTDPSYQILAGTQGGAYEGPSTIAYLAGKKDFSGLSEFGVFKDTFLQAIEKKDYKRVKNILSLLNIKYIFYNSDPYIYDKTFPGFPYIDIHDYFPTQKSYKAFLAHLNLKLIYSYKHYSVFEYNQEWYTPHIFSPGRIITSNITLDNFNYFFQTFDFSKENMIFEPTSKSSPYIKPEKKDIFTSIIKDFPISVIYPYARWKPGSIIYPLIELRENYQLKKFKVNPDAYIDRLLFLASKRISELERFGAEMKLDVTEDHLENFAEPKLFEINKVDTYNSWSAQLSRYSKRIQYAIEYVKQQEKDDNWKITQKRKINQTIHNNQIKLNIIIHNNLHGKDTKNLFVVLDRLMLTFKKQVEVADYNPKLLDYSIPMIRSNNPYEIFISTIQEPYKRVFINDTSLDKAKSINKEWDSFGRKVFTSEDTLLQIENYSHNIITDQNWNKINNGNILASAEIVTNDLYAESSNIIFVKQISGMIPKSYYLLSFDYNTYGADVDVAFYKKSNEKNAKYTADFREVKNTREWTKFNAIVQTLGKNDSIFLISGVDKHKIEQKISVRNFSVSKLGVHPDVILVEDVKEEKKEKTPNIAFQRINPTKYIVNISRINGPYTLVLQDAYSSEWKLLDPKRDVHTSTAAFWRLIGKSGQWITQFIPKNNGNGDRSFSYSEGKVVEKERKNIFLDSDTFSTWGKMPIADNRHKMVNGYANGWNIYPSDMNDKKEYTLVLELGTQRTFYISLFISLISVGVTLVLLIWQVQHEKV